MYVLGRISDRVPQMQGTEIILTDDRRFVLRTPENSVTPLSREQVVGLLRTPAIDWNTPEVPAQIAALLKRQVEDEREAQIRSAEAAERASRIQAEGELDQLNALIRGRSVLRAILVAAMAIVLGLGVWGIADRPEPPRRAAEQVAEGHLLAVGVPGLDTATYAVAAEVAPRLTGYLADTKGIVKTSSLEIVENVLLVPQTSTIPLHMRPLAFQGSSYRQTPVAVDQSLGSFAIYADNPFNQDPNFHTLRYVEVSTMRSRELEAGEGVMDARGQEEQDGFQNWDTVAPGDYDIDDHRIVVTVLYRNTSPTARYSRILWYNTAGMEGSGFAAKTPVPVVVAAADPSFKDSPRVSRDPAGKGYWVAYMSHGDNRDDTPDGRIRVIHGFDENAIASPPATASFYVDQLFGDGKPRTQSSYQLLGDRVVFVQDGRIYAADLNSVTIAGIGDPDAAGNYPGGYTITAAPPVDIAAAGPIPPQLLRDYRGRYHVVVVDASQRILAYPAGGGEPVVVCETGEEKISATTFRSHIVWLQRVAGRVELRENAVVPASGTLIRSNEPLPSSEMTASPEATATAGSGEATAGP